MRTQFISHGEKKKLMETIEEQFGIEKVPGMLIEAGNEKIRLFTGSLTREELMELSDAVRIELIGLYAFRREEDFRISFDSLFLLEDEIKKNIIELTEDEMKLWMKGTDLQKEMPRGIYILKYNGFPLGCGKSNGTVIFNYVPKNRRLNR